MKALARHVLLELRDCNQATLNDPGLLRDVLRSAAEAAGATILKDSFYQFAPYGVSGVVIIAESHISIHTWPEYHYAAVDIFTCGTSIEPEKAVSLISARLESKNTSWEEIKRGLMPEVPTCYPKQHVSVA